MLVFSEAFDQALDFLESQGKIRNRDISEGTTQTGETAIQEEKPEARIAISLMSKEDSNNGVLIAAIAGPLGGIALLVVVSYLLFGGGRRFGRSN